MGCANSVPKKKVIVVGGGYVGSLAAKELDAHFEVTLIEPRDAMLHKLAALRAAVVPGWESRATIPLDKLMKYGNVLRASVKSAESGAVVLEDGTRLEADYIVLCHGGTRVFFPAEPRDADVLDTAKVQAGLKESQAAVAAAKSVLIIGGGAVGVELAGEIKGQYADKSVTLVHSASTLVNNSNPPLNPAALDRLQAGLKAMGVDVKLGVKVEDVPAVENNNGMIVGAREFALSDGTKVTADLTFVTTGLRRDAPGRNLVSAVDEKNAVKVDEFLQVEGMANVFCLGDANNQAETKAGFTGFNQAKHTVQNIVAMAAGKPLKPYAGLEKSGHTYGLMVLPLGPRRGVGAIDKTILGDGATRMIKGKGLFSAAQYKEKGAPLPPAPEV